MAAMAIRDGPLYVPFPFKADGVGLSKACCRVVSTTTPGVGLGAHGGVCLGESRCCHKWGRMDELWDRPITHTATRESEPAPTAYAYVIRWSERAANYVS